MWAISFHIDTVAGLAIVDVVRRPGPRGSLGAAPALVGRRRGFESRRRIITQLQLMAPPSDTHICPPNSYCNYLSDTPYDLHLLC